MYFKMLLLFSVMFSCYCLVINKDGKESACKALSKCIPLKQCQGYLDLVIKLGKPLKPTTVDFLRAQQCGFHDSYPKVCCGALPKDIRVLKSSNSDTRPGDKNRHHNQGIAIRKDNKIPRVPNTTKGIEVTTAKQSQVDSINLKDKADALNKAFAYQDFMGTFDLFRRKRGSKFEDSLLDVEIR